MSSTVDIPHDLIDSRVNALRTKVEAKREELSLLEAELDWWESGRKFFDPNGAEPSSPGAKPTLREAILVILRTKPKAGWQTDTIIAELRGRGWLPTGKNGQHRTRSMLAAMARDGGLVRVGRGRYKLPKTQDPEWE